jgi:hypothetical protein
MLMVSSHRKTAGWQGEGGSCCVAGPREEQGSGVPLFRRADQGRPGRGKGDDDPRDLREAAEDRAACSELRYIIEDQAAGGDRVLSRLTIRGIHDRREWPGFAPTGMEFEAPHISIHRIEGGKIAEEWREGGGLLELTQERLEQEIRERERIEQELKVARPSSRPHCPRRYPL